MEFIRGWRVVRVVRTHTGQEKTAILSRTFASRDAALIYAKLCGEGAFIRAIKGHQDDVQTRLC